MEKKIINPKTNSSLMNNGKFEGWGTSLCWWANRIGYSAELTEKAAELFFGNTGLGMNIMRYNIGGGDNPAHAHITRTDSAIPGWAVYDENTKKWTYDYEADKNQINVMKKCVEAAGEDAIVEVFSNSPPYFMTVSGCTSGSVDAASDNLKAVSYDDFAKYLAHVTNYIQNDLGITVTSLSPMNEPGTDYWRANSDKQEGCHFEKGESQSKIIVKSAEALKKYELGNVILAASDETSTAMQYEEYFAYSDEAKNALGRINVHTYITDKIEEMGQLAREKKFKLWMSETDGSGVAGTNAGEMGSALWFGQKIIADLNALDASAWIMWQVIDNHISENGYNGNKDYGMVNVRGGFWGIAVADHDNNEIILTQKYYGFGQFAKYIRPGSTIIHVDENTIAAYDSKKKSLSVVMLNTSDKNRVCQVDLAAFTKIEPMVFATRTSGSMIDGEHWTRIDEVKLCNNEFVAELKANSITTYVVKGVEM